MKSVRLNSFEVKIATAIGTHRYKANRSSGNNDLKVGPQSNAETDINGAGGEIAFCKAMNLYPDLQFDTWPDCDAVLPCGATVDVKTTTRKDGRLLAVQGKKEKPVDIYVLITGSIPDYVIRGGLAFDQLISDSMLGDLGHGKTYMANQSDLWKIDNLIWRYEYGQSSKQ